MVELAELISELRRELQAARDAGAGEDLRFELGPVELEMTLAIRREVGGGGKVRFWIVELGGEGNYGNDATQRIKLTIQPRVVNSDSSISASSPLISGQMEMQER